MSTIKFFCDQGDDFRNKPPRKNFDTLALHLYPVCFSLFLCVVDRYECVIRIWTRGVRRAHYLTSRHEDTAIYVPF